MTTITYYKKDTNQPITAKYEYLGNGSFCKAYMAKASKEVLLIINEKFREKDVHVTLNGKNKHLPYVEHVGTGEWDDYTCNFYVMPYYKCLYEHGNYDKIETYINIMGDVLWANTVHGTSNAFIDKISIPASWKQALKLIRKACLKHEYKEFWRWDLKENNFGVNKDGEIIFRDVFYTPTDCVLGLD